MKTRHSPSRFTVTTFTAAAKAPASFKLLSFLLLCVTLAVLLTGARQAHAVEVPSIGKVTLSIGNSEVERGGRNEALAKGADIAAGDIIRTTASGHIHIRFIDGALVSVRPGSTLHVQEYRYTPDKPEDSLVKFYLENGTVREISGHAAQSARERFRLNTPLVAIGVRGTDFVTQANDRGAFVLVNQGAIVLTPLDGACSAAGYGSCQTDRSRELSSQMSGMALVYRPTATEPVLQPIKSLKGTDQITPLLMQEHLSSTHPATSSGASSASSASISTGSAVADSRSPESVLNVLASKNSLVWGRWNRDPRLDDTLTVAFAQAMSGRQVTMGDGYYFLFRDEKTPNVLERTTGIVSFNLQNSSAAYRNNGNDITPASVTSGKLGIDFTHHTFQTQLALNTVEVGNQTLNASGTLDPKTGFFMANPGTSDAHVAGAVALDIKQAGYLFSKPIDKGLLTGATLWGR